MGKTPQTKGLPQVSTDNRYPLSWPNNWKRTPRSARKHARFSKGGAWLTVYAGTERLTRELKRLHATHVTLSTNLALRRDGGPRSDQRAPDDPGVAVYFKLKGRDQVLACDTWSTVADNIAAIAKHIEAIRAIDRYGVGTIEQAFAGYTGLPPKGSTWRSTLGFAPDEVVTEADIERAYKERGRKAHPDVAGGSHDAMLSLNLARTEARLAIGAL
jgi:hypothetical protein